MVAFKLNQTSQGDNLLVNLINKTKLLPIVILTGLFSFFYYLQNFCASGGNSLTVSFLKYQRRSVIYFLEFVMVAIQPDPT